MTDDVKVLNERIEELCRQLGGIQDMTGPNVTKDIWPIEVGRLLEEIHAKAEKARLDYCMDGRRIDGTG